jgi:hypothetical protein
MGRQVKLMMISAPTDEMLLDIIDRDQNSCRVETWAVYDVQSPSGFAHGLFQYGEEESDISLPINQSINQHPIV